MTKQIIPSGGSRERPAIDLNTKRIREGERVLYDGFGGPRIGNVDRVGDNDALIGVECVQVTKIRGRIHDGMSVAAETALVAALREAEASCGRTVAAAQSELEKARSRILGEAGIK
jgi:hypothetical protein